VKIVHCADTHVGFRQYNLDLREKDFADSLIEIIDATLEIGPRVFVHSGDLFHHARPSNLDVRFVAEQIMRLVSAGIEVVLTPGNHDKRPTRHDVAPHCILELLGARVFGIGSPCFSIDGVEFWGIPYVSRDVLLRFLEDAGQKARGPAVGVMHQGLYPHMPMAELYPDDLPRVFSYIALGHYHVPFRDPGGFYAYPGSPQLTDTSREQLGSQIRYIYSVEVDESGARVAPHPLKTTRPFLLVEADEAGLAPALESLRPELDGLDKKPVLVARLRVGPEFKPDLLASALSRLGLRDRLAYVMLKLERREEKAELFPAAPEGHDILLALLSGDPDALSLARAMADAGLAAEAELESGPRSAASDRQKMMEAMKEAALSALGEGG